MDRVSLASLGKEFHREVAEGKKEERFVRVVEKSLKDGRIWGYKREREVKEEDWQESQ